MGGEFVVAVDNELVAAGTLMSRPPAVVVGWSA